MYPANEDLLPIAQVLKSYGTQGEFIISLSPSAPEDINLKEPIFILFDGLSVPFFIKSFRPKGTRKAQVRLEDIDSLEESDEIVGQKIYLLATSVPDIEVENSSPILGYTLFNQSKQQIGMIMDVIDYSGNICIKVNDDLIPFHEDLIITLDSDQKTITLEIAEGLL